MRKLAILIASILLASKRKTSNQADQSELDV